MKHTILSALASLVLVIAGCDFAIAVCGDVSGDEKVTSNDALRVLRKSVGQSVTLTCDEQPIEIENYLGFANTITCNGGNITAQMTWSRHPGLTWSDYTQSSLPLSAEYKRVDDPEISGVITLSFGACGSIQYDIDAWGAYYAMPLVGGAWIFPYYEPAENVVYLMVELAPIEAGALRYGDVAATVAALAVAPAPVGVGNAARKEW